MSFRDLRAIGKTRKKLGLTQSELAAKAGVSQSLIARIESGSIDPAYSKAVAVFNALDKLEKIEIPVSKIMSHRVLEASSNDSIEKIASKMKKHDVSQLPVVEKNRVIGSITESTILNQIASGANLKELSKRKVSQYVEDPLPMISSNTPVSTTSKLLEDNPAVLVTEKGKLVGIVTKADLLTMVHH